MLFRSRVRRAMPTSKKFFKKSENQLLIIKKLVYNICDFVRIYATVAQQVEQFTRNEQVASSNLASSSKKTAPYGVLFLVLLQLFELLSREGNKPDARARSSPSTQ